MIKTGDILHREKINIPSEIQVVDTIFVTEEMMILNHILDDSTEDRNAVIKIIHILMNKMNKVSLKNLRIIYAYNDEQLHKTKTKWNKAGVIKLHGSVYKLVNPLELTTLRARLMLKIHLLKIMNEKIKEQLEKFERGEIKIEFRSKPSAEINFKPDWMDW